MTLYRLQASIQDRSLLPRDEYVNTLSVQIDPAADISVVGPQICEDLAGFYTSLATWYSDQVKTNTAVSKVSLYLHEGLPPHPPLATHFFSMGNTLAVAPLPEEVAMCLSFRSSVAPPGTLPRNARGRIYLGPLSSSTIESVGSPSQGTRPTSAFRSAVMTAAQNLAETMSGAGHSAAWVVASPTLHRWYQVTEARIDDAWDTQRSRGKRPRDVMTGVIDASNGGPAQGTWVSVT